jgi:hypothetical protein
MNTIVYGHDGTQIILKLIQGLRIANTKVYATAIYV